MSRKFFGTDGVRGLANTPPMTAEMALKLGAAAGKFFRRNNGDSEHRVVIGKDTRRSGYMLESALTAGLTSTGMNVLLLGPVPTPAVGHLTQSMRADLGIMISASHNPFHDNGIKLFGPDGFKLSDKDEAAIEALLEQQIDLARPANIGGAKRIDEGRHRYVEFIKTTFPSAKKLDGLKVVVDCAHGAAYRAAPEALWELGAEVVPMGVAPDGLNINDRVGSTAPDAAVAKVLAEGADLGICLDGDADRVTLIDEKGRIADGDQVMALFAKHWAEDGRLNHGTLVATVMSNLGLERFLDGAGLSLLRTAVGDRYVVEAMRAGGFNLGGEQSGHIVMTDFATTGDGLLSGLHFLGEMVTSGKRASELSEVFETIPQMLKNVRFSSKKAPLDSNNVRKVIEQGEARLAGTGRLLIRKSGTEPLIRVMAECEDEVVMTEVVDSIVGAVSEAAG
ncbi:MAG TPA: phosphoglucosamine mutase [Rhodobacteraceae bacterium]|nr:phosphoglucosamine mutase [Paracoccaceae bacterium]